MKKKHFKGIVLLVLVSIFVACNTGGGGNVQNSDEGKNVKIVKITIGTRFFDLENETNLIFPKRIESFDKDDIKSIKGLDNKKLVTLHIDRLEPKIVSPTKDGFPFTLFTKAENGYRSAKIELKALQEDNPNDPTLVDAIVESVTILGKNWDKATKTITLGAKPKEAIRAQDVVMFVKRNETDTNVARVSAKTISLKLGKDLSLSDENPIEITITSYPNTEFNAFTIDVKVKLK